MSRSPCGAVRATRRARQQGHLERREPPGRRVLAESGRRRKFLLSTHEHDEQEGGEKQWHLHDDIVGVEIRDEESGPVPERVEGDRGNQPEQKISESRRRGRTT